MNRNHIPTDSSIGTTVYHATMPSGPPAEAADSLSGALNVASTLPADAAHSLVESARAAFTSGLNIAAVVAAVLVAGAALLAGVGRPRRRGSALR